MTNIKLIQKIREHLPLGFKLTHYLSAVSPTKIVSVKHYIGNTIFITFGDFY